jgi:hypothetical protein
MARNSIHFQKGLSVQGFLRLYGSEALCEAAHGKTHRPDGFRFPHAPLCSFLRTVVMNLLRRACIRSIHAGQQEVTHVINRLIAQGVKRL